jgi:cellulose biosynthesis protein BcsQ
MPSKQATDRVTILLERLKEFRNINPDLDVMGFFANRTNGPALTIDEENRLSALKNKCHDAWGSPVHRFGTFIPRSVEIRDAEDERRTLRAGDETFERFLKLADEVADSFPTFCRARGRGKGAKEVVS